MSIITTTIFITATLLTPVQPQTAPHKLYLPVVSKAAHTWPIPRPTPTPKLVILDFPLESIAYAHYYSDDAQWWTFYTDVTLHNRYPWGTACDMIMLAFKAFNEFGDLVYQNMGRHAADPPCVASGQTTRIEFTVPVADMPHGHDVSGLWFLLRWR